jgi:hypothetical protein
MYRIFIQYNCHLKKNAERMLVKLTLLSIIISFIVLFTFLYIKPIIPTTLIGNLQKYYFQNMKGNNLKQVILIFKIEKLVLEI